MEKQNKPKVIAFYLPQFHATPENDAWWGKDFTEWVNVKKAKPIYRGQVQPKVPLNNNYYNLLDKEIVKWQTELAQKYGVYGFCYWHYYFCGKKLLEKPAENLLKWSDIPQNFCFGWANVSWKRTWKRTKEFATTWVVDDNGNSSDSGLLVEQTYGTEDDWRAHFDYLLPFFKDRRYIKINNKPIFLIYYVNQITDAEEMFELWNRLATKNGFDGIHIISLNNDCSEIKGVNAIAHYGCGIGMFRTIQGRIMSKVHSACRKFHLPLIKPNVWNYKTIWKLMLKVKPYGSVPNYPGGFVRYDETARKAEKGLAVLGDKPELFKKYLEIQMKRAENIYHSPYLFLDAWNEWAEGNYLEPDEQYKYGYLEAVREVTK